MKAETGGENLSPVSLGVLLATILVVALLAVGLYLAKDPDHGLPAPEELLQRAETMHRSLPPGPADPILLSKIRDDYRAAAVGAIDPRGAAAAIYGEGQISLLLGDTPAATTAWERLLSVEPNDFERLRVMKSLGDLEESMGDSAAARAWYGRIVAEYGVSDLPPGSAMLVSAARRRLE